MKYKKYIITSYIAIILLIFLGCAEDKDITANGNQTYIDSVWIDNGSVFEGQQVKIDINFSNSQKISAIGIPVKVYGTGFTIDSVSFAGSRCPSGLLRCADIDTLSHTISGIWRGGADLESGMGLFTSLYLTANPGSSGEVLTIDSVTIEGIPSAFSLQFVKTSGGLIHPGFKSGSVTVN